MEKKRRSGAQKNAGLGQRLGGYAIWVLNTISTYAYFFHNAENFNRTVEGELNRNFLMHGMMYKPVLKRTCIKLFLLLESIVVAMPDFSLQQ